MFTSNIQSVIGKLEGFRRNIPHVLRAQLTPSQWAGMKDLAQAAMLAAARNEIETNAVPAILATMSAEANSAGIEFSLKGLPFAQLGLPDFWKHAAYDDVVRWVEEFKRKDKRDVDEDGEPLSDAVIAEHVLQAVRHDPEPWLRTDEPGHGALNPEGLAAFVGLVGIGPAVLERLLLAALQAWTSHVCQALGPRVGAALMLELKRS